MFSDGRYLFLEERLFSLVQSPKKESSESSLFLFLLKNQFLIHVGVEDNFKRREFTVNTQTYRNNQDTLNNTIHNTL